MSRFLSGKKKFLMALLGACLGVVSNYFPGSALIINGVLKLLGVYIGAEALLDLVAIKNGNSKEK